MTHFQSRSGWGFVVVIVFCLFVFLFCFSFGCVSHFQVWRLPQGQLQFSGKVQGVIFFFFLLRFQ